MSVTHHGGLKIIGPAISASLVGECRAGAEFTVRLIHAEVTTGGMRFQAVAA